MHKLKTEARIVTCRYELIDKFHAQNNQLGICNVLAFLDAFALPGRTLSALREFTPRVWQR
jgi:hypothetical protein